MDQDYPPQEAKEIRRQLADLDLLPRIYIDFTQRIEDAVVDRSGVCRPVALTMGPYHTVRFHNGALMACSDDVHEFELATTDGACWSLNDGTGDNLRYLINIHTVRPQNRPST